MTSAKKKYSPAKPLKSKDVPATQGMLYAVRDELKSHIISHEKRFDSVDKKFDSMDKKIDSVHMDLLGRFDKMDAKLDKMNAEIHRNSLLREDDSARNKFVLDQYALVIRLCEKLDKRIEQNENDFKHLFKAQNQR